MPNLNCHHDTTAELTPWGLREHFLECLTDPEQAAQLGQWRDAARKWWDHQETQPKPPVWVQDEGHRFNLLMSVANEFERSGEPKVEAIGRRLRDILTRPAKVDPVEPDGYLTQSYAPHFMGVVVGIPDQLGRSTQLYTFGRAGYLGEPITGVDRMIVDALLSHAKTSLYNQTLPAEAQQALNRLAPPPYYGGY